MKRQELQIVLETEGYRSDCYDLNGGLLPERLTLAKEDEQWSVYYSEHGLQTDKKCFPTEDQACEYLLAELRDEPNAKR